MFYSVIQLSQQYWGHCVSDEKDGGSKILFNIVRNYVCIYLTPPLETGYDTRSIFQWCAASLNSEFFFSKPSGGTQTKEPSLPYYLLIAEKKKEIMYILYYLSYDCLMVPNVIINWNFWKIGPSYGLNSFTAALLERWLWH